MKIYLVFKLLDSDSLFLLVIPDIDKIYIFDFFDDFEFNKI